MQSGISLKPKHYREIIESRPAVGFFEVHAENYMCAGGPPHRYLEKIRADYPLSIHGVGMSLGSVERPAPEHLEQFRVLIDRYEPFLISEHVAWSKSGGAYHADLLPLPMTREALDILARNVEIAQDALGRSLLLENPSAYIEFSGAEMEEPEFLGELAKRTGCGLLLDVNNVFVSARNHRRDPMQYLDDIPWPAVGEVHLAGHAVEEVGGATLLIDDHGSAVIDEVWALYDKAARCRADVPVLVEWDTDVPALDLLVREAAKADRLSRDQSYARAG